MTNNFPTIIPTMRYKDAPAAIEWLCHVLGFEKEVVYEGENGSIAHAQLRFGNGMIMLGSVKDGAFDKMISTPNAINGTNTQTAYLIVDDVKAHYTKAIENGASIALELTEEPHGIGYTCRDPEGYLWNFGDYNPWNKTEG